MALLCIFAFLLESVEKCRSNGHGGTSSQDGVERGVELGVCRDALGDVRVLRGLCFRVQETEHGILSLRFNI